MCKKAKLNSEADDFKHVVSPISAHSHVRGTECDYSCKIFKELDLKNSGILDIGCGDGQKTVIYKPFASNLIGLDLKKNWEGCESLKKAKERGILVVQGDAKKLPFRDRAFDVVISFHTIEHVTLKGGLILLNNIYNVLKDGGWFIMATPNRNRTNSLLYRFIIRPREKYPMNPDHIFEYDNRHLNALFRKSKFENFVIIPLGLIRLVTRHATFFEIRYCPHLFYNYCDMFMVLSKKKK